jgi:hypothetical protein
MNFFIRQLKGIRFKHTFIVLKNPDKEFPSGQISTSENELSKTSNPSGKNRHRSS